MDFSTRGFLSKLLGDVVNMLYWLGSNNIG